jgi:hypothetical protein
MQTTNETHSMSVFDSISIQCITLPDHDSALHRRTRALITCHHPQQMGVFGRFKRDVKRPNRKFAATHERESVVWLMLGKTLFSLLTVKLFPGRLSVFPSASHLLSLSRFGMPSGQKLSAADFFVVGMCEAARLAFRRCRQTPVVSNQPRASRC